MLLIRQIRGPETEPAFPSPRRSGEGILRRTEFIPFFPFPWFRLSEQIDQIKSIGGEETE
jgi:hypothetical protein